MLKRASTVLAIVAMATLVLTVVPAGAATITIDGALTTGTGPGGAGDKTIQTAFDASGSDKLVVVLGGEHGFSGNVGGNFNGVTYGGTALTEAAQNGVGIPTVAIFYLDNPGAAGDIVVNQENHNSSPYAIYLLSGTAAGIGNTADANSNSVSLATTAADSLVIAAIDNAGPDGGNYPAVLSADEPLTLDAGRIGNTRWNVLNVASATVAAPGSDTYSFSGAAATDLVATVAVEFLAVPEPTTMGLLVLGGLGLLRRRRRA